MWTLLFVGHGSARLNYIRELSAGTTCQDLPYIQKDGILLDNVVKDTKENTLDGTKQKDNNNINMIVILARDGNFQTLSKFELTTKDDIIE